MGNGLKILITAGGTSEKIDNVRKIKNDATGRLASIIAGEFVSQTCELQTCELQTCEPQNLYIEKIYYVCESGTVVPELPCVQFVNTQGVSNLKDTLTKLLTDEKIDAVIHSMAVSDYTVAYAKSSETIADEIARNLAVEFSHGFGGGTEEIKAAVARCLGDSTRAAKSDGKIASNIDNLMLSLRQTPKIIGLFKKLQPDTVLAGFKLLNGVNEKTLADTAHKLLEKNKCDLVLANDSRYFKSGRHVGLLVSPDGSFVKLEGKEQIAKQIVKVVLKRISGKCEHI